MKSIKFDINIYIIVLTPTVHSFLYLHVGIKYDTYTHILKKILLYILWALEVFV